MFWDLHGCHPGNLTMGERAPLPGPPLGWDTLMVRGIRVCAPQHWKQSLGIKRVWGKWTCVLSTAGRSASQELDPCLRLQLEPLQGTTHARPTTAGTGYLWPRLRWVGRGYLKIQEFQVLESEVKTSDRGSRGFLECPLWLKWGDTKAAEVAVVGEMLRDTRGSGTLPHWREALCFSLFLY